MLLGMLSSGQLTPPPSRWISVPWAALGTSITNYGTYVNPLNTLLGTTVTNLGVGGASVSSSAASGPGAFTAQVAAIPPGTRLITIEAGINDFRTNATLGTISDTTMATFYGALYTIVSSAVSSFPGAAVFLLTPYGNTDNYYSGKWNHPNDNGATYAQFVQAVRDTGTRLNVHVIDVGTYSGIGGPTSSTYLVDGIHLNSTGGDVYANYVYRQLNLYNPPAVAGSPLGLLLSLTRSS